MKANQVKGLKVKAGIKAGGFKINHTREALRVRSGLRAGTQIFCKNHNRLLAS
jgi:hypothetical protein